MVSEAAPVGKDLDRDVLPLPVKAGFGVGELGMSGIEVMLRLYLLEFYTVAVGLRADLAGAALAVAVLWDAVTDPAMGAISDATRGRFGRRKPYLALGAVLLAVTVYALFHPPSGLSQLGGFAYLLVGYLLLNTAMTIAAVPHSALAGELSPVSAERTELFGWLLGYRTTGLLIGTILPVALITAFGGDPSEGTAITGRGEAASALAVITLGSMAVTLAAVWNYDRVDPAQVRAQAASIGARVLGFVREIASVSRNPMFRPLIAAFVLAQAGLTINSALALFYYKHRLGLSEQEIALAVLGVFSVMIVLSIPAWVYISRRFGKKWPAFWGATGLAIMTIVVYPILPPGNALVAALTVSVIGGFFVASVILLESIVADVVDYDELRSGEHREGMYFGCWYFGKKLCRALGLAVTGVLLQWIGFDQGAATQTPEVGWRLALIYGPGVGAFLLAGAVVFIWMPLTNKRQHQIQSMLAKRRARGNPVVR